MGRIKHITEDELHLLRNQVRARFLQNYPNSLNLKFNAYKPNYQEMRADMLESLEHPNGSVSHGRLRKLFFYTDAAKAGSGYENPRFGVDFLDACYLYSTDNKYDRASYLSMKPQLDKSRRIKTFLRQNFTMLIGVIIVILMGVLLARYVMFDPVDLEYNEPFVEEFDQVGLNDLHEKGWQVLDYDRGFFENQLRSGYFTMHTLSGGYYTKPHEEPFSTNTLVHKIPQNAQSVVAYFDLFKPDQNWQGVSIVLYDDEMDKQRNVILNYTFGGDPGQISITAFICCINGAPAGDYFDVVAESESNGEVLRLAFSWDASTITALSQIGKEWDPLSRIGEFEIAFTPKYVGIMATQGITNDNGEPVGADVIPVYLDKLLIE